MFSFGRKKNTVPSTPLKNELSKFKEWGDDYWRDDDYLNRVRLYLSFAHKHGLASQAVVYSCIDLAATYTTIPEVTYERKRKLAEWKVARTAALASVRPPRLISMELDPAYFAAILGGTKTYEGRAYKPDSDKNYPDIRSGDMIFFQLSTRQESFPDEAASLGLDQGRAMTCEVGDVLFAPTVHGAYQIPRFNGLGFQPMIQGPGELLQLQWAAVYHTFPGYHELIDEHGFIGIEVVNPALVAI